MAELLKHRLNLGMKLNLSFFRDSKGLEVDTIADWKHTIAIEIKSSGTPETKLAETRKNTCPCATRTVSEMPCSISAMSV